MFKTTFNLLLISIVISITIDISILFSKELLIIKIEPPPPLIQLKLQATNKIKHGRIAIGNRDLSQAWFAGPTKKYHHGVFGNNEEASQLVVKNIFGKKYFVNLPMNRVFEDIKPRFANINGDNTDEILVIESHIYGGASLAVYDLIDDQLVKIASTPFIGKAYRWLNPIGVGDFSGDGSMDVALVITPHIGGILILYKLNKSNLTIFAKYSGVSNHSFGSTELGLGQVVFSKPIDLLVLPDNKHRLLILLEWTPKGWIVHNQLELPGKLKSSLNPVGFNQWRFKLDTGNYYQLQLKNAN